MVQEIITYTIIAIAVFFTVLRFRKKFGKKKQVKKTTANTTKISGLHNCSDCSAECVLRDTSSMVVQNNSELCKKIETASSSD